MPGFTPIEIEVFLSKKEDRLEQGVFALIAMLVTHFFQLTRLFLLYYDDHFKIDMNVYKKILKKKILKKAANGSFFASIIYSFNFDGRKKFTDHMAGSDQSGH